MHSMHINFAFSINVNEISTVREYEQYSYVAS